jgi:hypothetical protein
MSMDMERPLILYQVVEVETVQDGVTGEVKNYVHGRRTFADKQKAEQERKEMLKAEREACEGHGKRWSQLDFRVSVEELKVSPRTIEKADRMDKERHETLKKAARSTFYGLSAEEDRE